MTPTSALNARCIRLVSETCELFCKSEVTVPTLPEGFTVEEVRRLLSHVLADAIVLGDYLAAVYERFGRLPVAVQDKWFSVDEPDVPAELIIDHGPAGLDAAGLARLAMSGPTLEHWNHVLTHSERYSDRGPGSWFFEPLVGNWPVEPRETQPPQTEHQPPAASASLRHVGRRWGWFAVTGLIGVGSLCGVVGLGTYRAGERVHQSLDQFESETARGKYPAAVGHVREAQAAATGSTWPVPGSAKARLELVAQSPRLLDQLLPANDLTESEAALRDAVDTPLLDRDPAYRYALGLTLRRAGKLADAAAEFETVLARLGEKPKADAPAAQPPGPDPSEERPIRFTKFIVVDLSGGGTKVRFAHAMTLLELGESRRATAWLMPMAGTLDDRPFGPNYLLWVSSRAQIADATLQDIVTGRLQAVTPGELRDHAYSCLYRNHFTTAAKLFERLFAHPDFAKLAFIEGAEFDVSRYHAAAAAVRAGRFGDLDAPDDKAATEWHNKALKWADEDLATWLHLFATSPKGYFPTYWWYTTVRYDSWLGPTRDRPRADELTLKERESWKKWWDELDARFQGLRPLVLDPKPTPF